MLYFVSQRKFNVALIYENENNADHLMLTRSPARNKTVVSTLNFMATTRYTATPPKQAS